MRKRDQEQVRERCHRSLTALLEPLGRVPGTVRADNEGWVNVVLFVDDLVVRFNVRDPQWPKIAREAEAYRLMGAAGLPVPEVLHVDTSRSVCPYDAMVLSRMPGMSLERRWKDLESAPRETLAVEVGALLRTVHAIRPGGFGELALPAGERHATFATYIDALRELRVADALRVGAIEEQHAARVRAAFAAAGDALAEVGAASLVHGDYHFGNVLVEGGRVTALLDLEWSRAGDPLEDLCIAAEVDQFCPGARTPVAAGYLDGRELTEQEQARFRLHRCLRNLEMCEVAHRTGSDEFEEGNAVTRAQIESL